jgi:hypothetical protein
MVFCCTGIRYAIFSLIQRVYDEPFLSFGFRRSLILSMPGYSFECHTMYSMSEDQSVLDMLPLVSCIFYCLPIRRVPNLHVLIPSNPIRCCASALSLENKWNQKEHSGRIRQATLNNSFTQHTSMPTAPCSPYAFACLRHPSLLACLRNAQDADVEKGSPLLPGLVLIEPLQMNMDDIVARCCGELLSILRRSRPLTVEKGGAPLL